MREVQLQVNPDKEKAKINKEIYGHFSEHLGRCIYEGIFVSEDSTIPNENGMRKDVVEALKEIDIPVLRWPGGCFADEYHWKDGIGPKENRKKMINTNWGGLVEDNSFGTHEFFELCRQLECEPYLAGNLGSGTVQELSEWIEYITFDGKSPMADLRRENGQEMPWKLKYLGIGNENWGCGGNMSPEYYSNEYKRYQTFCKNFSGNELYKVACGPNADDYNWTRVLMQNVNKWHTKAISLHYYTVPGDWEKKGSAVDFSEEEYYETLKKTWKMEELIENHLKIMDEYDKEHEIGLIVDEWGTWYDVEEGTNPGFLYQQNTMRDALVAAINLNIFNQHADRVVMANIAQVVNVLQAVILTEGTKILKTPTYYVFEMYKKHQEAKLIESYIEQEDGAEKISYSVSKAEDGVYMATLSNPSLKEDVTINIEGIRCKEVCESKILSGDMKLHNTFEKMEEIVPREWESVLCEEGKLAVTMPPCSVVSIRWKEK